MTDQQQLTAIINYLKMESKQLSAKAQKLGAVDAFSKELDAYVAFLQTVDVSKKKAAKRQAAPDKAAVEAEYGKLLSNQITAIDFELAVKKVLKKDLYAFAVENVGLTTLKASATKQVIIDRLIDVFEDRKMMTNQNAR
jgi:hypothetical protein